MSPIGLVAWILGILLSIYVWVLIARLVLEYIPMFNRGWRPRGGMLVAAEIIYTVTDPPIKLIRRVVPPLRVGAIAIDLAFMITMVVCFILMSVMRALQTL